MIGGDLFRRFFFRFLLGLGVAFLLFLPLVHVSERRTVTRELREDLQQEARWLTLHLLSDLEQLADAWGKMHGTTRITFYDADGRMLADSHPERDPPDLEALQEGRLSPDAIAVVDDLRNGGWLVMSRPLIPGFPHGLQWELVVAAVLLIGLALLLIYPPVRSMSTTLGELGAMAREVSSGHFGKTLALDRSDELGALVRAFNDMSKKLAEAEQLSTRLLHDVSHELRSPLARIQVLAQTTVLRPDEATECIRGIEQEIELLDRLVGDLLQAARIESDGRTSEREVFPVADWARETLRRLESRARSSRIDWTTRLPANGHEVRGDPQRLAQAVGNLVDNAIHALEGRDDPRIEVSLSVGLETWTVAVEDNGPGIPDDALPHVFRRFYRVDEHRDRDHGGVGLGLSLVRAIAEAHGGEASVESRVGEGTRVTLSLPVA